MNGERRRIWIGLLFAGLLTVLVFVNGGCAADTYTVCPRGCDYTSIQAAIDASQPGNTIEVHSGTYYENVNVDEQLILRGIDTGGGKPVVDAGGIGSAIRLSHDGSVLDGFTAINASSFPQAGILISSKSNIVINNTALNNAYYGINLISSSNNTLTSNIANANTYYGVLLSSSSNNTLTGNTFKLNNDYGISLGSSSTNLIYNNYLDNTNNAWDNGDNIWNISTTGGTNIINGPYIGGNYWSDYTGEDTNGDGLGDTLLPYDASGNIINGGDWLPLVKTTPGRWDVNEDCIVNFIDLTILSAHWLETTC
jgi:parallel beta-helix repeat protein